MKRSTHGFVLILILSGCAMMKNTPIQDYILEIGHQCERGTAQLDRVDAAGRYWYKGFPADMRAFEQCMAEKEKVYPFNEWYKARGGGGTPRVDTPQTPAPVAVKGAAITGPGPVPEWKPGYQWTYSYESPRERGTFAWIVNREELVDGTPFYVIGTGNREIYFRKSDRAISVEKVNGAVDVRYNPPIRLATDVPGEKWELRYVLERPQQQSTENLLRTCESTGPETITVPAGTFETVKTRCVDGRTGEPVYESWYATPIKQMVKDRLQFSDGWHQRELIGHRLYTDRVQ